MLAHLADAADRQIAEHEGPVTRADQAGHLEPQKFENAADFAILALGQDQLDPHVGASAAFKIGVDRAVAHTVDLDALDQVLELRLRHLAISACAIGALDPGRRQFELALEPAVGGQQ